MTNKEMLNLVKANGIVGWQFKINVEGGHTTYRASTPCGQGSVTVYDGPSSLAPESIDLTQMILTAITASEEPIG
jgi:hypothetical protein